MRLGTLDNVLHEVRLDEGFLLFSDAIARKKHKDLTASLLQETMPVKHSMGIIINFRPVIKAEQDYLVGGRMVDDGPVFNRFCEALYYLMQ